MRNEWGFEGLTVSDCNAIEQIMSASVCPWQHNDRVWAGFFVIVS